MDQTNRIDNTTEQRAGRDPRWSKLTLGALSWQEAAELQREDPERYERCRPLEPNAEVRILARVEARLAAQALAPASEATSKAGARLFGVPWSVAAAGVASAAVLVGAFWLSPHGDPLAYLASWSRSDVAYVVSPPRGDRPTVPTLDKPDARIEEALSPAGSVEGPVVFRGALLVHPESGIARRLRLDLEPTQSKEFFISGTRVELFPGVPSGDWDLLVAIGRPGPVLSESEIRQLVSRGPAGDRQVLKMRVVLRGDCVGTAEQPCLGRTP